MEGSRNMQDISVISNNQCVSDAQFLFLVKVDLIPHQFL